MIQQTEVQTLVEQAQLCVRQRRLQDAVRLLERALQADPVNPLALTKLGEVALLQKDYKRAHRLLWAALEAEPFFAPAWTELAHSLWLAGRRIAAAHAARRAVDIQPYAVSARLRHIQFAAWTGQIC